MTDTTALSPNPSPSGAGDRLDRRVLLMAGVVVLGAIMSILDITIVTVAQPAFQNDFGVTPAQAAWTMTGYTLALASIIPVTGWAADRFGTKRLYLTAIVLFTLGSLLCALAWSFSSLVLFRVLQGLGGGMLAPLGMTILTRAAGPQRIGRVMAVMGLPMLLGPIFGPILGGWLIDIASWHWIFLINLPIGLATLGFAWVILPKDSPTPSETFDFVGMLMLSPGLAAFLYGVSTIPETQTLAAVKVAVPIVVGALLIVGFVVRTLKGRAAHPLIDLSLFRNRTLTTAIITLMLFAIAFFGASLLFPAYFLQVRGESTLNAGLMLAPQGLGAMIVMPIAGIFVDRIGPGKIILAGVTVIAIGMGMFSTLDATTSYLFLMGALFVMGAGMGATMMPVMTAALQTLKDHQIARGSTTMNIAQQVAASIGTAVFTVILTRNLESQPLAVPAIGSRFDPSIAERLGPAGLARGLEQAAEAFSGAFVIAAILVAVVLIPAAFLPRKRPDSAAGLPNEEFPDADLPDEEFPGEERAAAESMS